jgi:hypothetical protein
MEACRCTLPDGSLFQEYCALRKDAVHRRELTDLQGFPA